MTLKVAVMMMLPLIFVVSGCGTDPRLKNDCDWAEPIRPSRQDVLTRQTKEQILAHNEAAAKICGWKK